MSRTVTSAVNNKMSIADTNIPNHWLNVPISTGTTIMAAEYKGGVIVGADSRTTAGSYVSNRVTNKLTQITDHIYVCRSGSAADTQAISDIVKYHLNFHSLELGEVPLVESTAAVFRQLCYTYRESLVAGILVAGWDRRKGGQIYSIPMGGMCIRQGISIGGSGASYIYGFVDERFKPDMTQEECEKFVIQSIALAILRDGSSGGIVRLGIINEKGIERKVILGSDLPFPELNCG